MKKTRLEHILCLKSNRTTFRKMKLTLLLTFLVVVAFGKSFSQESNLTFNFRNANIREVLKAVEQSTDYVFIYKDDLFDYSKKYSLNIENKNIYDVLEQICAETGVAYDIRDHQVILREREAPPQQSTQPQERKVSGVVLDSNGEPIPGVNVRVVGTTTGTITDTNGNFSINVPSKTRMLQFSFVGMKTKEVDITGKNMLNVVLEDSAVSLNEIVAVGYGIQKKRDLTGSIVSVNMGSVENSKVKDVMSALQGRAAGVQVVSNSGAPGDGITVTVRGQSSLNSGNSPLYVIDGVPVETNSLSQLNGWNSHGLNPLADINPSDIQSIEVLKDAASTSIYGARAANGVILITTKRGQAGKAKVSINASMGYSKITRFLSVLNATQWRQVVTDAYRNLDYYNGATTPTEPSWTVVDSLSPRNNGDVDWQNVMYRTAKQSQVDFSVAGGSKNSKYAFSTSVLDQDGIFLASNYKRITSRLNTDFTVSDKMKIGQSVSYTHGVNNRINAGGTGNNSLVVAILVRPPTYSLTFPDGSPINYFFGKRNPVALAEEVTHLNTTNRIIGNQYLEYELLKGLKFRANLSLDFINMKEDEFYPTTVDYRAGYNRGAVRSTNNLTWANDDYLTYTKSFNDVHHLSAMAGFSTQEWKTEVTGLDGMYFASDNIHTLNGAGTISNQAVNVTYGHSLASYFGRLTYDYKSKYLFEANFRADGSSRFGKDNRFGYFPSASAAWRFSDEPFVKDLNFFDDGKLRFSVGQTGNEAIGNYTSQGEFAIGTNYLDNSGASPTVMPNSALHWETTTQYDAGMDLTMLNNRVSFIGDVYVKNTSNLLFAVPIPETTGFNYITKNIGEIQNKGLELSLTTYNFVKAFKWNTSFNISFNRNKVVSLPEDILTNGFIQNGSYHILKEGEPIGVFYGWKSMGVYSRDEDNVDHVRMGSSNGKEFKGGDVIWEDLNGDHIIDDSDRQIIGDAQPKFTGGLNNELSYKNFSLNVFFQFSYGNDIYSNLNFMRNWVNSYNNVSTDALNRWREQGDVTNYPKPTRGDPMRNTNRVSDRWIEDGSYIRLKNVNLAYDFPNAITDKLKISGLRLYVTGQNLVTWTHYTGYDPEVSSYSGLRLGIDDGAYPQSRTFIMGLNVKF